MGLIGISKENYRLISCYASLCSLISGITLYLSIVYSGNVWAMFIVYLFAVILSVSFAKDVRQLKTATLAHNYLVTSPNPQYVTTGAYPVQFGIPGESAHGDSRLQLGHYAPRQLNTNYGNEQETSFSNAQPLPFVQPPPYSVQDPVQQQQQQLHQPQPQQQHQPPNPGWKI